MTYHDLDPESLAAEPNLNCHGGNGRPPRVLRLGAESGERSGKDPLTQVQPQGGRDLEGLSQKQLGNKSRPPSGTTSSYKVLAVDKRSAAHCTWVPPKGSAPHSSLTSEQGVNLIHTHPHPHPQTTRHLQSPLWIPTQAPTLSSRLLVPPGLERVLSLQLCIRGCGWFEFLRATMRAKMLLLRC